MKQRLLIFALAVVTGLLAHGATNDLASTLQRGLFEEEANQNLPAAIQAYQEVITRFDKDRRLAATAVFRLGECFRKQSLTNEAAAQYERVAREFPDQAALVTLSRQNLAGLKREVPTAGPQPAALKNGTDLLTADEAEQVKKIQALIKDSPDLINARTGVAAPGGSRTQLQSAAGAGQLVVARFLLENNADVEAKDLEGRTALHMAAQAGHKAMVELLLSHKADPNALDNQRATALHLAASRGYRTVVEVLLAGGANPNLLDQDGGAPLGNAARAGLKSIVELLLANKAEVNVKGEKGYTSLWAAAGAGHQVVAALLIDRGAEVNAQARTGETPLSAAVAQNHLPVVRLLLSHKADPNIPYKPVKDSAYQVYPLHTAVQSGHAELTEALLQAGANPNVQQEGVSPGYTPLFSAVGDKPELVPLLLKFKANPNVTGSPDFTPLHLSLAQPAVLDALLAAKADVNATNKTGATPLHWAANAGLKEAAEKLIAAGARVDTQDVEGRTPLYYAVYGSRPEMVDLLLAAKADPNLPDRRRLTPLQIARNGSSGNTYRYTPIRGIQLTLPTGTLMPGMLPVAPAGIPVAMPGSTVGLGGNVPPSNPMVQSLKQSGAIEDLPRTDRIEVRRPSADGRNRADSFVSYDKDWNQFTLLEILAEQYGLLSSAPEGDSRGLAAIGSLLSGHRLAFPDFSQLRVRRPSGPPLKWQEQNVDLTPALKGGDRSCDVVLQWGDVVEVTEIDHPINTGWNGFTEAELKSLQQCLSRTVELTVKGQPTKLTLTCPDLSQLGTSVAVRTKASFWLLPVLRNSGRLLTSSDLSRVKVTRTLPGGDKREYVLDCSDSQRAPAFWLRDADLIEVPDRK